MKPEKSKYKIAYMGFASGEWIVLSPYNLFVMPDLCKAGVSSKTKADALVELERIYQNHLSEYERLKTLGRSWPDND